MNIKINKTNQNILLSRIEIDAVISFDKATPSLDDVKQALGKELEVEKDLIVVDKITTAFGNKTATIKAKQYLSKEDLAKIEPKKKEKKAAGAAK